MRSELYRPLKDKKIYKYLPDGPPSSLRELKDRFRPKRKAKSTASTEIWVNWVMRLSGDVTQPVGLFQLRAQFPAVELAYIVFPAFRGRGYASEAGFAVIDMIFRSTTVKRVTAGIDKRNRHSCRVAEAIGLVPVSEVPFVGEDGKRGTRILFEVRRHNWRAVRRVAKRKRSSARSFLANENGKRVSTVRPAAKNYFSSPKLLWRKIGKNLAWQSSCSDMSAGIGDDNPQRRRSDGTTLALSSYYDAFCEVI